MHALFSFYTRTSLIVRVTAALLLGVALGLLAPAIARDLAPLGDLLIRLLKFLILPIVLCSVIVGINQGETGRLGRTGVALFVYYVMTTVVAMIIGLAAAMLLQPGTQLMRHGGSVHVPDNPGVLHVLLSIVPKNVVSAFAHLDLLAVIFTSLVFGIAIASMRASAEHAEWGDLLYRGVAALNEATMRILRAVLHYIPIGIFAIVANTVAKQGVDALTSLAGMIGVLYLALLIHLVFYTSLLTLVRGRPLAFWRAARTPLATAFATQSSAGTLPLTLNAASRLGLSRAVYGLALPLGATINMDGAAIRIAVSAVFAANVVGISLGWLQMAQIVLVGTLASIGTAGVPGAGIVMIATVFAQVGLPIQTVALLTSIDALVGMGCTAINVVGDLVGASVIDRLLGRGSGPS